MKRFKKVMLLLMALCLVVTVGCGNKKELTLGETKDNVYTNDFFGLEATIPEGWVNADRETIDEITKAGVEIVSDGDEDKKEQLEKLTEQKTLTYVMAFKYDIGTVVLNPNVIINSEKVSLLQGINDSKKYLQIVQEQLQGMEAIPYEVSDEVVTEKINDTEWSLLEASIDLGDGSKFIQKYYSVLTDGYIVNIIATYTEEDGKEEIEQFLKDLKINEK